VGVRRKLKALNNIGIENQQKNIEFKIKLENMKWNHSVPVFVESRTFDTRLTKSALLRDFKGDTAKLMQRPDYRQFKSNYPKES
jgi:hypothetical protein